MSFFSRILSLVTKAEGDQLPGPYLLNDGWLPVGTPWNFWQTGQDVRPYNSRSAMVQACESAYAQTVAMCPGDHWRRTEKGGRERVDTSSLTRILRRPNDYQSISDFLMNLTWGLYNEGNAYALALRNARFEINELHLMNPRSCVPQLAETGEIFYNLGGNEIVERRISGDLVVPARDVLHVRLRTPRHPLKGESPMLAAAMEIAATDAMMLQQIQFHMNQGRPSTVLTTDAVLTKEQVIELRERWNTQSRGLNSGGTPILSSGLKPVPLAASSEASQLADMFKISTQQIALAYRVPLAILGIGGTTYASTELLMQQWIASGLGFALNHIEEAFGQLFALKGFPDEYLELNTKALLRSAFKDRIEGLTRGLQGGLYSPDEARNEEDLPTVQFGDQPRVQQQMVPLSYGAKIEPPDPNAKPDPAAPTPDPAAPEPKPDEPKEAVDDDAKHFTDDDVAALAGSLIAGAESLVRAGL